MGCAFDMFSTTWNDRSYVVVLFVLCWCIPLIIIFYSYGSIFFRVRKSNARDVCYCGTPSRHTNEDQYSRKSSKSSNTSYGPKVNLFGKWNYIYLFQIKRLKVIWCITYLDFNIHISDRERSNACKNDFSSTCCMDSGLDSLCRPTLLGCVFESTRSFSVFWHDSNALLQNKCKCKCHDIWLKVRITKSMEKYST